MLDNSGFKQGIINSLKILLIGSALALMFGLIAWFIYGTLSFSQASAEVIRQAWEAIAVLVGVVLSSGISSLVIVFGIFVLVLLVWRLSGFLAQYEAFQPEAGIIHQIITPVGLISGLIFASPVLIPYSVIQVFKGNTPELLEQAKKASNLLTPQTNNYLASKDTPTANYIGGIQELED